MASPLDAAQLRERVQRCVDDVLAHQSRVLAEVGPDTLELLGAVARLLSGGKRLRAAFLYWGYRAAGQPDSDAVVRVATAMEFFQAAALIHDDVMDDSDTRRGMPATHRSLAARHQEQAWAGDAGRFGVAGAILAGNLCLNWTEELYATSGLEASHLARGRSVFDVMRTQLMGGQFLDVVESARPWTAISTTERIERAERVIRFKSAKYTVEHPLLIGAVAGGADEQDVAALSRFGLGLGQAFQLRDDLLGVFGDPVATGKPAGDDLREGKRTVLVAHALAGADAEGRAVLEGRLGDPGLDEAAVERLRDVISASGAVDAVEADISRLAGAARMALKSTRDLQPEAVGVLDQLIDSATTREY
ncbi:polyprenyl synthetase family protein [Pedococcus sp. 5OH_020]|uniref:polyprenyl synthetase family protein n=1 Tax=Pedococcus sp. 5OH_020 TaxID=2989814 RepID=UPI0022EA0AB4|nr:polyprenyl synthetase family protein [Pedococcus sp. 5OH_020]